VKEEREEKRADSGTPNHNPEGKERHGRGRCSTGRLASKHTASQADMSTHGEAEAFDDLWSAVPQEREEELLAMHENDKAYHPIMGPGDLSIEDDLLADEDLQLCKDLLTDIDNIGVSVLPDVFDMQSVPLAPPASYTGSSVVANTNNYNKRRMDHDDNQIFHDFADEETQPGSPGVPSTPSAYPPTPKAEVSSHTGASSPYRSVNTANGSWNDCDTVQTNLKGGDKKKMTPHMLVDFYSCVAETKLSKRGDRDFQASFLRLMKDCPWADEFFVSKNGKHEATTFKQKIKSLLQERRPRAVLMFWTQLNKMSSPSEIVDRLDTNAKRYNVTGDFTPIAEYLMSIRPHKKSPGSIMEWPEEVRRCVQDIVIPVHLRYGTYNEAAQLLMPIVAQSEVEMIILNSCTCSACSSWHIQTPDNHEALRLEWMVKRAAMMRNIIELHIDYGQDTRDEFIEAVRESDELAVMKNWPAAHIRGFLDSAHYNELCHVCAGSKRIRRGASSTTPVENTYKTLDELHEEPDDPNSYDSDCEVQGNDETDDLVSGVEALRVD